MEYFGDGLAILMGYLIGSVSFGIIVSKLKHKDDIRTHGSGNAGMTNALRVYGGGTAALVFIGDFLKGYLAVWLGHFFGLNGFMLAALAVVVGHLFPVFFGFRGGKGVATAAGAILAIDPMSFAIVVVPFALILLFTRYMSLAAITAAVVFPLVFTLRALYDFPVGFNFDPTMLTTSRDETWLWIAIAFAMGGLVIYMHRANIGRLLSGTESKVGQKAKK